MITPVLRRARALPAFALWVASAVGFVGGASPATNGPPIDCRRSLDAARRMVEEDYAGFPSKVTPKNRGAYVRHTAAMMDKAADRKSVV